MTRTARPTTASRWAPGSPATSRSAPSTAGGHKIFAVVHKNTPRGLLIWLEGSSHDQWIVGCADPETLASSLGLLG